MKKNKSLVLIILTSILFCSIYAQVPPMWNTNVGGNIIWQEVTSLGSLIVGCEDQICGVNAENGETIWSLNQFGGISRASYQEIPNSPFITINKGDVIFIIEQFGGRIIFDSKESGVGTIKSRAILYKNNGILIAGEKINSNDPIMLMVDMSTAEIKWKIEEKFGRIIATDELSNKEILIVSLFNVYKLNSHTGEIIWKRATSKAAEKLQNMGKLGELFQQAATKAVEDETFDLFFYKHPQKDLFIIATESEKESSHTSSSGEPMILYKNIYYAFKTSNGDQLWEEPLEVKGQFGQVALHDDGLIVLPRDGNRTKINMFDYTTKEGKWGKKGRGIPIKGSIYSYAITDKGYLLISDTRTGDFLNILDPVKGITMFKKSVKIDGRVAGTVSVPKGIIYITSDEVNIVDPVSGEVLLPKSIQTEPSLTAEKNDKIYIFDTKEKIIKVLDKNEATVEEFSTAVIKFKGKESPKRIELREKGIFIKSDQNVAMVGYTGKLIFQEYYPAPREPAILRALMYAEGITNAYIGTLYYASSAVYHSAAEEVKDENAFAGLLFEVAGDVYEEAANQTMGYVKESFNKANARFKATAEGKDYMIILSPKDKANMLYQISKDTGKPMNYVNLGKEKEPEYAVDDIEGIIFLKTGTAGIEAFNLNK